MQEHDERRKVLDIHDLTVDFHTDSRTLAVKDLSFETYAGTVLAIVGESGSGKSVTVSSLLGLLPAYASVSGEIRLAGNDEYETVHVSLQDHTALRTLRAKRISLIFQDPYASLDPVFTVFAQLQEAVGAAHPEYDDARKYQRSQELLALVHLDGIEGFERKYPHEFSGGQLQRAIVAIALAGDPQVLLADEPTTALDSEIQQEVLDLLHEISHERDTSVVIITHDMGVVADLADYVLVMHNGAFVEYGAVDRIFEHPHEAYTRLLLDSVPSHVSDAEASSPGLPDNTSEKSMVSVRDLDVCYSTKHAGKKTVVHKVSFDIQSHEILALVGQSGSGKSTIAKSLLGVVPVAAGAVKFQGRDVSKLKRDERRSLQSHIGMIFQSPSGSLNPSLRVREILFEPLRFVGHYSPAQSESRAMRLLDAVHLGRDVIDRYPSELSGGQRQRVAIARAIALDPWLLIADEPTSALDVSVQSEILSLLKDLQQQIGFACLFISHDLALVRDFSHRTIVLKDGRIMESGRTEDVFANPRCAYTRDLLLSAPVANPRVQRQRRNERHKNKTAA